MTSKRNLPSQGLAHVPRPTRRENHSTIFIYFLRLDRFNVHVMLTVGSTLMYTSYFRQLFLSTVVVYQKAVKNIQIKKEREPK